MMKKVLITGANGFIGSHLVKYFMLKEYDICGWDVVVNGGSFNTISVDMFSFEDTKEALEHFDPEIIIHCAGAADVGKSMVDPLGDYQGNVTLTHNLLEAIHSVIKHKVVVVFVSSAAVYGDPEKLPVDENAPLVPKSQYAVHKIMCEQLCAYYNTYEEFDIRIARIFSAYGVGLKKQIFWDMYNKLTSTGELEMYGTGDESRDYIYIDDVVNALYLIATSTECDFITNVANGVEISINCVANSFANIVGVASEKITFNNISMPGTPNNWLADVTKLTKLGYRQSVGLEEGIRKYIDWAKEQV